MERGIRRRHIPAFGEWNQLRRCEELPITQYFDSAMQAGLGLAAAGHYHHHPAAAGEVLLFRASSSPPQHKAAKKVRSTTEEGRMKRGACVAADGVGHHAARRPRVVRAVDEDLYQVPPELLRKKAKGRKNVRSLWMGCVGLNCVA